MRGTLGLYSAFLALAATFWRVIFVFRFTVATKFCRVGVMPEAGSGAAKAWLAGGWLGPGALAAAGAEGCGACI